ncbi:MAG: CPBP family intramembrane metalloprotease [Chloroflexi bacterium]|nr:CPBP family intramembrane metalloprotease [Chloroflexota bacterium]
MTESVAPRQAALVSRRELLLGFLFPVAVIGGAIVLLAALRGPSPELPSPIPLTLAVSLLEAILILPPWYLVIRRLGGSWADLGFREFLAGHMAMGCALWIASYFILLAWFILLALLGVAPEVPEILPFFGGGLGGFLLAILAGAMLAPLAEEIYFRGFLFAGLRGYIGPAPAIVLSSAIFALFHLSLTLSVPIFILGCFLAWLYHFSGSLWPSIALHVLRNAAAIGCAYLLEVFPPAGF